MKDAVAYWLRVTLLGVTVAATCCVIAVMENEHMDQRCQMILHGDGEDAVMTEFCDLRTKDEPIIRKETM